MSVLRLKSRTTQRLFRSTRKKIFNVKSKIRTISKDWSMSSNSNLSNLNTWISTSYPTSPHKIRRSFFSLTLMTTRLFEWNAALMKKLWVEKKLSNSWPGWILCAPKQIINNSRKSEESRKFRNISRKSTRVPTRKKCIITFDKKSQRND